MSKLIRDRQIVDDTWQVIRLAEGETPAALALPEGDAVFPLAVWLLRKQEIIARYKRIGIWLDSNEAVEDIAEDLNYFQVIALNFPKFADGRAYSSARLLRERYGYRGELRAIGDVLQDQLFYMKRVGFDAFAVRADKDIEAALKSFEPFPETYQTAVDQPLPLFRRRAEAASR